MALLDLIYVQFVYAVATVMAFTLSAVLWRYREKTGAKALGVANGCSGVWSGSLLALTLTEPPIKGIFARLLIIGVAISIAAIILFALEYTGRERYINRKTLALFSIHPIVTTGFVLVNPGNLFFAKGPGAIEAVVENPEAIWGPAFFVHTLYAYLVLASVAVMVLELLVRSSRPLYRGQATALLLATFIPWFLNASFLFGPVEFDVTPVGFLITTTLFSVAIVKYRLIDITPIARQKVIQNVRDGMFVVDTDDTILDSNPAFRELVELDADSLVGLDAKELFADFPEILTEYEQATEEPTRSERQVTYGDRYLNVEATPIRDDREKHVGWLFLVHDVTELIQRERDLEQQIEKLDQFAGIVSHDLRNPLNVARGYVQQAQATGDIDQLEKTDEAMERMEAIIEDALALAREGEDVTEPDAVSLAEVATDAWANVDTESATFETDDEIIIADKERLQRMFENLFRNSVEHGMPDTKTASGTNQKGGFADGNGESHHVAVGLEDESADTVTLSVADNGTGIPEDDRDNIFESGFTTNEGGTGLGLSIVQQIAKAHGWEMSVSESEWGGAQFNIHGVPRKI